MRAFSLLLILFLSLVMSLPGVEAQTNLDTLENQILELCNKERTSAGLSALTADDILKKVARGHSEEMLRLNYFDHESPLAGRRYPWDRVNRVGFDSNAIAENLYFAEGYPMGEIPAQTVRSWMKSPTHRENLLSPKFTRMAIGLSNQGSQVYVTQVFSQTLDPYVPEK